MKSNPQISIIVPCYNAEAYVGLLCDSIQQQTFTDFEVLILDDGSSDRSREVVAPYQQDDRFHIEHAARNQGVGAATAYLLERARGEFWTNPGADDLIDPGFLERRLDGLRQHPHASLIHGPARLINSQGGLIDGDEKSRENLVELPRVSSGEPLIELLLEHNVVNVPSVLVRMEPTRRILPLFDPRWQLQDWCLWLLLAALETEFIYDGLTLNSYRLHAASISHSPERETRRTAETRLVPLVTLGSAQDCSASARTVWQRWGGALYALWMRRAIQLRLRNQLRDEWMQLATKAFYGKPVNKVSLMREALRHAVLILKSNERDRRARKRLKFPVAGVAEIGHPAFH